MSKKTKKENQFITRNIQQIKKYGTHLNQTTIPLEHNQL